MRVLYLCLLILTLTSTSASANENIAYDKIAERAFIHYIQPAVKKFEAETSVTSLLIGALCENPDQKGLTSVRQQFKRSLKAWSAVEILRFGPLITDNNYERFQFYPDRKGLALKIIRRAFVSRAPDLINPELLVNKSIVLHGFGALEYILFGANSDTLIRETPQAIYRCALARTISIIMSRNAATLRNSWSSKNFARFFLNPSVTNPIYKTSREPVAELIKTLTTILQAATDQKLGPPLGKDRKFTRPKLAIFYRSEQTFKSIQNNMKNADKLFQSARFDQLLDEDSHWVSTAITTEFANLDRLLNKLHGIPVQEAFLEKKHRVTISLIRISIAVLYDHLKNTYANAAGLLVGFNALDGD
ncbi:MAG: imelysin family protein [Cohaesibacteraceae bacterium]|nr:imelysin family protein [Cohaesibacteraceae bacterium]